LQCRLGLGGKKEKKLKGISPLDSERKKKGEQVLGKGGIGMKMLRVMSGGGIKGKKKIK
jgi:hypothetical protein